MRKICGNCQYFKMQKNDTHGACYSNPPTIIVAAGMSRETVDEFGNTITEHNSNAIPARPLVQGGDIGCRFFTPDEVETPDNGS